jgi:peptidoglycan hydrolase-like protein with peptidoglycan-binding domain
VAATSAALALVAGCGSGGSGRAAPARPTAAPSASDSPASGSVASAAPASLPSAPAGPRKLKTGTKGADVKALQERLTELGYWNGEADGVFGALTQQAVYALQKTAGLGRDGVVGPRTRTALDKGVRPRARSGSGRLVEISLKRQLLMFVDDGTVTDVLNTATGSNEHYTYEGKTYLADTPPGHFTASRQIDGWRHGPLGPLWRPKYFNGGIAVHGAYSIPPYPASHGCARVSIPAMNWIWAHEKMPLRTKVWVY